MPVSTVKDLRMPGSESQGRRFDFSTAHSEKPRLSYCAHRARVVDDREEQDQVVQLGVGRVADADRCGLDSARAGER
jgi:hypothetical protein